MSWRIWSPSCAVVTQAVLASAMRSSLFIQPPGARLRIAHLTAPAEGVKKRELLAPAQPLQLVLAPERGGVRAGGLAVQERERAAAARVPGAPPGAVRGQPLLEIVGDAGVQRAVRAAEEIDAPHAARRMASLRRRGKFLGEDTSRSRPD